LFLKLENTITQLLPTVRLSDAEILKENFRADVVRFATEDGTNLIGKKFKAADERYFAERIALEFLNDFNNSAYPRYLGSDDGASVLVMSDLGKGSTLETLLSAADSTAATDALLKQAQLVARLHIESLGQKERYQAFFAGLNKTAPDLPFAQSQEFRGWLSGIEKTLAALNLPLPENVRSELDDITNIIARPGDFETFTHGDIAPSQTLYTLHGAHLLDFEYSGYRHALYDVLGWQIVCPYPPDVIKGLNETYRRELAQAVKAAADDNRFYRDLAALCLFDLARYLHFLLPAILTEDKPWAAGVSARRGITYKLVTFADCTQDWQVFPALQQFAADLRQTLLEDWGAEVANIGGWRAFGGTLTFP
jgi:hypothetical protein